MRLHNTNPTQSVDKKQVVGLPQAAHERDSHGKYGETKTNTSINASRSISCVLIVSASCPNLPSGSLPRLAEASRNRFRQVGVGGSAVNNGALASLEHRLVVSDAHSV